MRKLNIILYILGLSLLFSSCEDEIYVHGEPERRPEKDYGDVEAKIEARLLDGTVIEEADMGDEVTFFDTSLGRPDTRTWTIETSEGTITSNEPSVSVIYTRGDKAYDVKLEVSREDGQKGVVDGTGFMSVNTVPIVADFISFAEVDTTYNGDGVRYMLPRGETVSYIDKSLGFPDSWNWTFEGGTPVNTDERNPEVKYDVDGIFPVKLEVSRTFDGQTNTKIEEAYINVIQAYMVLESATVKNKVIELHYDQDIMGDPSAAKDDFSVKILTASGDELTASVASASSQGSVLSLTLNESTYHDDFVQISYENNYNLVGANANFIAPVIDDLGLMDADNIFASGTYDPNFSSTTVGDYRSPTWVANNRTYNMSIVSDKYLSGTSSAYIEIGVNDDNTGMDLIQNNNFTGMDANKKYKFGMWVYMEEIDGDFEGSIWWITQNDWKPNDRKFYGIESSMETHKWVFISNDDFMSTTATGNQSINLRIQGGTKARFYMDHMILYSSTDYRARP